MSGRGGGNTKFFLFLTKTYPIWIFFVVFIVLTSFAILNLFIAVIVDSLQAKHFDDEEEREEKEAVEAREDREALRLELAGLRDEIASLRRDLGQGMRSASAEKARDSDE